MGNDDPRVDLAAAVLFTSIGAGAIWFALDYPLGTLRRLGPGALPVGLGVLLVVAGLALMAQAGARLRTEGRILNRSLFEWPRAPNFAAIRSTVCIVGGLVVFGLLIRPAGLFTATAALVLLSSRADPDARWVTTGVLTIIIPILSVAIFVYGIGLPIRVWP